MRKINRLIITLFIVASSVLFSACSFFLGSDDDVINNITFYEISANVKVVNEMTFYQDFNKNYSTKIGSGAIVAHGSQDDSYYFLTNYHVVENEDCYKQTFKIMDYKGTVYSSAGLVCSDSDKDLALMKFNSSETFTVLKIKGTYIDVGDAVFSVGSPSGQINAITTGTLISKTKAPVVDDHQINNDGNVIDVYCHSSPIYEGSSGGMLLNEELALVGINYAGEIIDGEFKCGYSITSVDVIDFLSNTGIKDLIEIY